MKVNPRSKRSSWQEAINADRTRDDIGCLRQREVSSCAMGVERELGHVLAPQHNRGSIVFPVRHSDSCADLDGLSNQSAQNGLLADLTLR
jgi:hypothetical protein